MLKVAENHHRKMAIYDRKAPLFCIGLLMKARIFATEQPYVFFVLTDIHLMPMFLWLIMRYG